MGDLEPVYDLFPTNSNNSPWQSLWQTGSVFADQEFYFSCSTPPAKRKCGEPLRDGVCVSGLFTTCLRLPKVVRQTLPKVVTQTLPKVVTLTLSLRPNYHHARDKNTNVA